METRKVWLVTGASKGLGLTLVKKLLAANYRVVATSRNSQHVKEAIGPDSADFLSIEMNLIDDHNVRQGIERSIAHFGRIDVLVNNAGYGQLGTLEELSDKEARANFDVNVFGTINVIRQVMPYLRQQQSGNIFNISSVGGLFGSFAGWGVYCASKFAVAGLSEALAEETKSFGIKVMVVYPGYFRTDFLTQDSIKVAENPIQEYQEARESEAAHLHSINGNQPNDPEKAADVLIAISLQENPPVHLLLGEDAYTMLNKKVEIISKEAEQWKSYSLSTAY